MIPISARDESTTTDSSTPTADANALLSNILPTSFLSSFLSPASIDQANGPNPFSGPVFPTLIPAGPAGPGGDHRPQGQPDGKGNDGHNLPASTIAVSDPLPTVPLFTTPSQAAGTIIPSTSIASPSDGVQEISHVVSPSQFPESSASAVTITSPVVKPSPTSTSTAINGANADTGSSSNSFFSNKAAVIGTFTTAGIILLILIAVCAFRISHRRRLRREEKRLDMESDKIITDFAEKTLLDAQNNKSNGDSTLKDREGARPRRRINLDDPNPNMSVTRTITKKEIPVTQDGENGGGNSGWTEKSKPRPESLGYGYGYGYDYNNATTMDASGYGNYFNTGPGPVVENQNHPNLYGLTSLGSGPANGIPYPSSTNAQGNSPSKFPNPYEHTHPITHPATSWNQSNVSLSQEPMQISDTYAYGGISQEYEGLSTRRGI